MLPSDIRNLLEKGSFQVNNQTQAFEHGKLKETHISYLLLTEAHAFKIKKPVKAGFLDFSSLSKRKYFCEKELELNRRLTTDMYLEVLPVFKNEGDLKIGGDSGEIIDYALVMKRMDNHLEMDVLLAKKQVSLDHIYQLARKIAAFHQRCYVIPKCPNIKVLKNDFNEIKNQKPFITDTLGEDYGKIVEKAIEFSDQMLEELIDQIKKRYTKGMVIDGHGDLHSRNIFLYDDPVIFDCIEFNDEFRHIDLLDEIAFFCMDLESFGAFELSNAFYQKYNELMPRENFNRQETKILFNYYKCYRANVRAKVTAMYLQDYPDYDEKKIKQLRNYLDLMARYCKVQYKSQLPFK